MTLQHLQINHVHFQSLAEVRALMNHSKIRSLSPCEPISTMHLLFPFWKKYPDRNIPPSKGCESLPSLNGSGRRKNKVPCLPLVISKLLCLSDGLEELNYYNKYHFQKVSFGIQRHQIKIFILWNFNITHILVVVGGAHHRGFSLTVISELSNVNWPPASLSWGKIKFPSCSVYHFFLVSLIWHVACFQCN